MTDLVHWQDDSDNALGGDFDGSLSGLCIMSLSFDFSKNGSATAPVHSSNKDNNNLKKSPNRSLPFRKTSSTFANTANDKSIPNVSFNQQANSNNNNVTNGFDKTTILANYHDMNRESTSNNDNSGSCFKRFKSSHAHDGQNIDDEEAEEKEDKLIGHKKGTHQIQHLATGLNPININSQSMNRSMESNRADHEANHHNRISPQPSEESCQRVSSPSISDDLTQSPPPEARSLSPSSISSSSHTSPRSISPDNDNNDNILTKQPIDKTTAPNGNTGSNESNHLGVSYSGRDNQVGCSSLKESSYTTSVITTTAPMHFKNRHHPFSLKQFPMSPYHQFSNSSFNHDMYDKYLSLDSHPPLQTPLIGIERTQDLLSLKLPPHGPDDFDSQRFSREWLFDESRGFQDQSRAKNGTNDKSKADSGENAEDLTNAQGISKTKDSSERSTMNTPRGFPFNYKSNSSVSNNEITDQHEPIDLNINYDQEGCYNNQNKNDSIFNQSMKHFNPDKLNQNSCFDLRSKQNSPTHNNVEQAREANNSPCMVQQCGQESMFGIDPSKQKFQYLLSAPISVATKLNEDTMTYLNQAQAYEIKLENVNDVSEVKKGFMCSIINIGFHERHMQQAENELWQQWSQQHPNEKIFSVDMKLSYNVFGVESDGLNKYEFLWDSSKAAGVFIRINSISTEFTLKKHGGEKGVPFKISIETFSYNSKTHESYFISAACCQIKVFKPKGAERKFRSDRDKVSKKPPIEQEKYHRPCDHTIFRDCSLTSLHPFSDRSNYYRHSHGHFASKQVVAATNMGSSTTVAQSLSLNQSDEDADRCNNGGSQHNSSPETRLNERARSTQRNDADSVCSNQGNNDRDYHSHSSKDGTAKEHPVFINSKTSQTSTQCSRENPNEHDDNCYSGQGSNENPINQDDIPSQPSSQPNSFNQLYSNSVRSVTSFSGLNNTQHFGMAYYSHTLPTSISPNLVQPVNYGPQIGPPLNVIPHHTQCSHSIAHPPQDIASARCLPGTKPLVQERKQISAISQKIVRPTTLGLGNHSFQTSNLATHIDQPIDTQPQEVKDSGLNCTMSCQNEHFESPGQTFHPTNIHYHQQPFKQQRSSAANLTTISSQTSGFISHGNQNRHIEGYIGPSSTILESTINSNYWIHGTSNHPPLTSPNSFPYQRHSTLAHSNNDSYGYNSTIQHQNIDNNSSAYDHEHGSSQRNNQNESDGCSRLKNDSLIHCGTDYTESLKSNNPSLHITANSNCVEVLAWLTANRFGPLARAFNNFSGSDLLRLSKDELIEICGLSDGIRLNNCLHNQPIKPRKTLYVCLGGNDIFHPVYLYNVNMEELLRELSKILISQLVTHDKLSPEKVQKTSLDYKPPPQSGSSSDSRSSMGTISNETGTDDIYSQGDRYFPAVELPKRNNKLTHQERNQTRACMSINRLLIDGLTSVKIVATEQVIQVLENESVWNMTYNRKPGFLEACLIVCSSKRFHK